MKKLPIPQPKLIIITVLAILLIGGIGYAVHRQSVVNVSSSDSKVHLTDYTDNDGGQSTIVLSGAIGDFGKATNSQNSAALTLSLTHGSFRLDTTSLRKDFASAISKLKFNQKTCSGTVSVASSVPIVAKSGTGSYKKISGDFKLTASLDEAVPLQANCNANGTMLGQAIVISGWGTVARR